MAMNTSHIRSPKRHSRFLFMISLPETEEFVREMPFVNDTISKLTNLGVDVYTKINSDVLSKMTHYDYVIVIAHHDEMTDSLVLQDQSLAINDFVNLIPEDFCGVIDFSSCYSAGAMAKIKARTNYKCKVQAVVKQTTLALRLIMYPHIVNILMENEEIGYDIAYSQVLDAITLSLSQVDNNGTSFLTDRRPDEYAEKANATKLGDNFSTIYAPSQIKRNQPFLVNLFFHKEEETGTVELMAQRFAPNTSLVETQIIPIDLNIKDRLTARLSIISDNSDDVNVNNGIDTKSIIWFNRATKIQFPVTVSSKFSDNSFICEIKIEVNSEPIGECMFVVSVSETESQVPCSITLTPHDQQAERNSAKTRLQNQLTQNLSRLAGEMGKADSEYERIGIKAQYDVCKKCLSLIEYAEIRDFKDSIKKVFISSTSDMAPYRDVVKNEILSCGMFPIDYRTWYQSEKQPCDVCCQKVLESDVVICIIGARYGYVEPSIGISMTQMEYETALMAGKKIRVYIIDPLEYSNENEFAKTKQIEFINEIKSSRILKFFSDDYALAKDATRELSYLK